MKKHTVEFIDFLSKSIPIFLYITFKENFVDFRLLALVLGLGILIYGSMIYKLRCKNYPRSATSVIGKKRFLNIHIFWHTVMPILTGVMFSHLTDMFKGLFALTVDFVSNQLWGSFLSILVYLLFMILFVACSFIFFGSYKVYSSFENEIKGQLKNMN